MGRFALLDFVMAATDELDPRANGLAIYRFAHQEHFDLGVLGVQEESVRDPAPRRLVT